MYYELQLYRDGSTNADCAALADGDGGETGDSGFDNVQTLKRTVDRLNCEQTIRNLHIYGPLRNDSIVVVIQVRTVYDLYTYNAVIGLVVRVLQKLFIFRHDSVLLVEGAGGLWVHAVAFVFPGYHVCALIFYLNITYFQF